VKAIAGTGKIERLFRSPWFWLALIVLVCEFSSLVQGNGLILRPEHFWLMICYAFIFGVSLLGSFDHRLTDRGTIHFIAAIVGCLLYLAFAFSARWFSQRLLYRLSLGMLLIVLLMSAGCTAWVMSWQR
jgi:hypothetical protein